MKKANYIPESELILNPDGSVYHLNLLPEDIGTTVITVGDQDRVHKVSKHFDTILVKKQKREFLTHTGLLKGKKVTVISTGIGTDNIDIVLNELDALVNIDFESRTIKPKLTQLDIIRIGTSGSLQADIPNDSFLVSNYGVGFDGLMTMYQASTDKTINELKQEITEQLQLLDTPFYVTKGNDELISTLGKGMKKGITLTCGGFYGAQGRVLRLSLKQPDFIQHIHQIKTTEGNVTNFEMETAGIYALSALLGHRAVSFSAILANRITNTFSKQPQRTVEELIEIVLQRI